MSGPLASQDNQKTRKREYLFDDVTAAPSATLTKRAVNPVYENVAYGLMPKNADTETQWPTRKRAKVTTVQSSSSPPLIMDVESAQDDILHTSETPSSDTETSKSRRSGQQSRSSRGLPVSSGNRNSLDHNDPTVETSCVAAKPASSLLFPISSSRVGPEYQVADLPTCGTPEDSTEDDVGGQILWDPEAAKRARLSGHEIDKFMEQHQTLSLPIKTLLLQALHEVNYDTAKATTRFVKLVQESRAKSSVDRFTPLTKTEKFRLDKIFSHQIKKDFVAVAKSMGLSTDTVMIEYYKWKSSKRKEYQKVKKLRHESSLNDYCDVCKDGGTLIECSHCPKSFHLKCLDPPLKEVPEGAWFCPTCRATEDTSSSCDPVTTSAQDPSSADDSSTNIEESTYSEDAVSVDSWALEDTPSTANDAITEQNTNGSIDRADRKQTTPPLVDMAIVRQSSGEGSVEIGQDTSQSKPPTDTFPSVSLGTSAFVEPVDRSISVDETSTQRDQTGTQTDTACRTMAMVAQTEMDKFHCSKQFLSERHSVVNDATTVIESAPFYREWREGTLNRCLSITANGCLPNQTKS